MYTALTSHHTISSVYTAVSQKTYFTTIRLGNCQDNFDLGSRLSSTCFLAGIILSINIIVYAKVSSQNTVILVVSTTALIF